MAQSLSRIGLLNIDPSVEGRFIGSSLVYTNIQYGDRSKSFKLARRALSQRAKKVAICKTGSKSFDFGDLVHGSGR
jgi:hypothetical protein